jgi:hypothetical protein
MRFDFENLQSVLGKPAVDPAVIDLIQRRPDQIERSEHLGFVTIKECGVSIVFVEAPWLLPPKSISDPKALYLGTFHLHRNGHEGLSEYSGQFPNGVAFRDSKEEIVRKLGNPIAAGGGGFSNLLKKPIPHWLRYSQGTAFLQFQLDNESRLEMATLYVPDYDELIKG